MGSIASSIRMKPERTSRRRDASKGASDAYLSLAARRQREYRDRQRRDLAVLDVAVNYNGFAGTLIAAGWLSEAEALDRRRVAAAAASIIAEWQRRWRE